MKEMVKGYLKEISEIYSSGRATEQSYYPALKDFLERVVKAEITVVPKKTKAGIPDFLIRKRKRIVGYIEAKEPKTKYLDQIASTEQLKRYKDALPSLILTNFLEFILYRNKKEIMRVQIAQPVGLELRRLVPQNIKKFEEMLQMFFRFFIPPVYKAKQLALELARRTRFLRHLILEELNKDSPVLTSYYEIFRRELLTSSTEEKFADLYAQTLTYGLFFSRIRAGRNEFSRQLAYKYIPKTLSILQHLFYFLTGPEIPESLEWIVDDIAEVLAYADLSEIKKDFHTKTWTEDPVIHFYETFLKEYDPKERKRLGVYYTPEPVVSYIVRSIHKILKEKFNKPDGLADKSVTLLDPAAGTLTFPAMAVRLCYKEFEDKGLKGAFPSLVKDHILKDFYAFELMVAPYAIGHFKIGVVLEDLEYRMGEEGFRFYLTNTLELKKEPKVGEPHTLPYDLAEEGKKAEEVKERVPVLVVFGNPPYSVHSENKSDFIEELMDDYKEDVRGERNIQPLSDDYIKFLRFAQWRIEKTGQGIVGMITNNSYLSGLIHRGMRKKLFEGFDEIYILNLHGNARIGEQTPEGGKDENVFDIQQGVGIVLFVKYNKERSNG